MSIVSSLFPCWLGENRTCEPHGVLSLSWLGVAATDTTAFAATSATKFAFTDGFSCVWKHLFKFAYFDVTWVYCGLLCCTRFDTVKIKGNTNWAFHHVSPSPSCITISKCSFAVVALYSCFPSTAIILLMTSLFVGCQVACVVTVCAAVWTDKLSMLVGKKQFANGIIDENTLTRGRNT